MFARETGCLKTHPVLITFTVHRDRDVDLRSAVCANVFIAMTTLTETTTFVVVAYEGVTAPSVETQRRDLVFGTERTTSRWHVDRPEAAPPIFASKDQAPTRRGITFSSLLFGRLWRTAGVGRGLIAGALTLIVVTRVGATAVHVADTALHESVSGTRRRAQESILEWDVYGHAALATDAPADHAFARIRTLAWTDAFMGGARIGTTAPMLSSLWHFSMSRTPISRG